MKRLFIICFVFAAGTFLASCSDSSSSENTSEEIPAATSTEAKTTNAPEISAEDRAYEIIIKGLNKRKIVISPDQDAQLQQLIEETGITESNAKEKLKDIRSKLISDILTEEQRAKSRK